MGKEYKKFDVVKHIGSYNDKKRYGNIGSLTLFSDYPIPEGITARLELTSEMYSEGNTAVAVFERKPKAPF